MKALCKRYYPYEPNDVITLSYQTFHTGETYDYEEIYRFNSSGITETWYLVKYDDEYAKGELFSEFDFEFYFLSTKKQRKIKLYNLANEQDIQRMIYGT